MAQGVEQRLDAVQELLKPRLRGWLHTGALPVCLVVAAALVVIAPDARSRIGIAVFGVTGCLLFGVSALYNRGQWGPATEIVLKRVDHANIFLIIAGSYTPFSVLLLPSDAARHLLWIIWTGAGAGVVFRVLWVEAPRWLYVPLYVLLGWVALAYLPQFLTADVAASVLVIVGGGLYTAGALVYGLKVPNPSPKWFAFHEVFHLLTVLAFLTHCTGILLAVR